MAKLGPGLPSHHKNLQCRQNKPCGGSWVQQHRSGPAERGRRAGVSAGRPAAVSGTLHTRGSHPDRQTLSQHTKSTEMKEGDQTTGLRRQMQSTAKHHGRKMKSKFYKVQ